MTRIHLSTITFVLGLRICSLALLAEEVKPIYFDAKDTGEAKNLGTVIAPWKIVALDTEYGGKWVVAADLDNDGQVEIISCENFNQGDVHYTSTAVAQELNGKVLWRWGQPAVRRHDRRRHP